MAPRLETVKSKLYYTQILDQYTSVSHLIHKLSQFTVILIPLTNMIQTSISLTRKVTLRIGSRQHGNELMKPLFRHNCEDKISTAAVHTSTGSTGNTSTTIGTASSWHFCVSGVAIFYGISSSSTATLVLLLVDRLSVLVLASYQSTRPGVRDSLVLTSLVRVGAVGW